jgi:EAL domain-containing protein (putative c-di-GMP-specific phosphodiesterase class I)
MHDEVVAHIHLLRDLRTAVPEGQLRLVYQPQVDLRTGRIRKVEALARWQHPHRGLVAPDEFIPVAESAGIIEGIDDWALHAACEQLQAWDAAGLPALRVAVNVSARRLSRGDVAETILASAGAAGVEPARLEIEITETGAVSCAKRAAVTLRDVRALGVSIAIDDFGMGHSSFSRLQTLPVDRLKIDRSFVRTLTPVTAQGSIAGAMVALGASLGLDVVAEGIETQDQLEALRALGCPTGQGYLLGRPLPADDLLNLVGSDRLARR